MRILCFITLLAACSASDEGAAPDWGGASADAGAGGGTTVGCQASNECPAGYVCNDFGRCEVPPSTGDAGVTPPTETEVDLGAPTSSERFVYVAMTEQDELA